MNIKVPYMVIETHYMIMETCYMIKETCYMGMETLYLDEEVLYIDLEELWYVKINSTFCLHKKPTDVQESKKSLTPLMSVRNIEPITKIYQLKMSKSYVC